MKGIGKWVVKLRHVILIAAVVLLIPSGIGYLNTRINYDVLTYLPKDIETMVGQDILLDEFGQGAVSMVVVRGMEFKDVASLKAEIEEVPHVKDVIWYDSFADLSVPMEMLPKDLYERELPRMRQWKLSRRFEKLPRKMYIWQAFPALSRTQGILQMQRSRSMCFWQ